MTVDQRSALFRWTLTAVAIGVLVYLGRTWNPSLLELIEAGSLVVMVVLVQNLGLRTPVGEATFMPTASLIAYLSIGRTGGLVATGVGMLVGCGFMVTRNWRTPQETSLPSWARITKYA